LLASFISLSRISIKEIFKELINLADIVKDLSRIFDHVANKEKIIHSLLNDELKTVVYEGGKF